MIDDFPPKTHALAGAVFNTVAQFGTSLGLAIMSVLASSVTRASSYKDESAPEPLLLGYWAVFWATFGIMILTSLIGGLGLRRAGRLGTSKE